jgi:ribose 5-phosphate isomerase B
MSKKIYLAADHRGFRLKADLFAHLSKLGFEAVDCGNTTFDPEDDYPLFAQAACLALIGDDEAIDSRAILVCGSGHGMAIAANRFEGVRAALVHSREEVLLARRDDDINVLVLSGDEFTKKARKWRPIVDGFLTGAHLDSEKYTRRIKELDNLDGY